MNGFSWSVRIVPSAAISSAPIWLSSTLSPTMVLPLRASTAAMRSAILPSITPAPETIQSNLNNDRSPKALRTKACLCGHWREPCRPAVVVILYKYCDPVEAQPHPSTTVSETGRQRQQVWSRPHLCAKQRLCRLRGGRCRPPRPLERTGEPIHQRHQQFSGQL